MSRIVYEYTIHRTPECTKETRSAVLLFELDKLGKKGWEVYQHEVLVKDLGYASFVVEIYARRRVE